MNPDVLVAGAGPTGLTLAIELARRDVPVRIVDAAERPLGGSKGDGLQPRTLEVFDDLGVLDAVFDAGRAVPDLHTYVDGVFTEVRRIAPWQEPTPDVPYPNGWMLGQARTEEILRGRLSDLGVTVEPATAVTGFVQDDDDGVTTSLSTGETVRSAYLVGADGGRSTVRKTLGIPFDGTTDESIRALVADVRADALDHSVGHWFHSSADPAGGVGLTPLAGGRHFQLVTPPVDDATDAPTLDALQTALDATGADVRLTELAWSTLWRVNVRLARHFRKGRVFLAGDSAHVHPPTGGQGLNTGVQDAYNLGWKLAEGSVALLDTYETERRAVAQDVLGLSTRLLRKHVDGAADAHERGTETRQLGISYRTKNDSAGGICAGDRAPDAPLRDPEGRLVRLFDLFRGPHPTTLVFGDGPLPDGAHVHRIGRAASTEDTGLGGLVDVDGHAFATYGAGNGMRVEIRPDGYIAAVTRPEPMGAPAPAAQTTTR